ncbi:MAG TPA: alkaline phosphatase [Chthoniobacterales bacterium]|jgi:alkaline phosphatase
MSKKLRNRFIALFCLLAFVGAGFLFYTNWVVQRPFAIILFIGDGLTTGMLAPARIYNDGAQSRLELERLPHLALLTTYANDFAVPDAAAAASALATGRKVNNRVLSLDAAGKPLTSIVDLAQKSGRSIGLVSNASLTDATLAAFYAKTADPLDHQSIADQLAAADFDLLLGGGSDDFLPESKEGRRTDGRDVMLAFRKRGYDIVTNRTELLEIPAWRAPRVFGVFQHGNLEFADVSDRDGSQPSLADLVRQAISRLQYNPKGYLLVVDAGLIAKAAHSNEGERMMREIVELDRAVGAALQYAGDKALIIVTGKQSVGGFRMNGYPFKNDRGMSVIGINPQTLPFITWSTGPGGAVPKDAASPDQPEKPAEPSAVRTSAAIGVAEDVIAISTGPGSEKLQGFKDNTDVFRTISDNL